MKGCSVHLKKESRGIFQMPKIDKSKSAEKKAGLRSKKKDGEPDLAEWGDYHLMGKYKKALGSLKKAVKIFPKDANNHYWHGGMFSLIHDNKKALESVNKAIRLNPNVPLFYDGRGNLFLSLGEITNAIHDFNKAIKMDSESPAFYNSRGKAFFKLSKPGRALKDFYRALKIDPKNEKCAGSDACLYLSRIMYRKGDKKRANIFFAKAIKLEPFLIYVDDVWQFARDGYFPALEYLYNTAKGVQN
jgi:tetratricopeptide (TPR) repeat protein